MGSEKAMAVLDTLPQGSLGGKNDKNEVVIKRKIGLLGAIGIVIGTIIGKLDM